MIKVLRVDDRLLHGQVAVSWVNFYQADVILIANDHVITDQTTQMAFKLATPPGVTLSMKSLDGAVAVINNPKHAPRTIMVITKTIQDAEYLCAKTQGAIKDILLGGLRSGEGKRQIDNNSYMSEDDIAVMNRMEQEGLNIAMQATPSLKRLGCEEIRKNFNKNG